MYSKKLEKFRSIYVIFVENYLLFPFSRDRMAQIFVVGEVRTVAEYKIFHPEREG